MWWFKDIELDSISGLSINRAYDSILTNLGNGKQVIVALIDMPLDIEHEDLQQNIWVNPDETPNNQIDDDNNGYVDDINGWNFISSRDGKTAKFVNYEYTRILKKYSDSFKNNTIQDSILHHTIVNANKKYKERLKYAEKDTAFINVEERDKKIAAKTLSKFFKGNNYSIKDLDSLKKLHTNDSLLKLHIEWMKHFINYKYTDEYFAMYKLKAKERFNKLLNVNYNDRTIIGDNSDDINDKDYGSPIIGAESGFFDHSTKMAGFIAARRDNAIGIEGVSDNIKIMPICISAFGDEHDKDIALAIRYAVDNGAKVVNMSYGKEFSLYKEWVFDAIKYAEEKDVLIIKSAGNNRKNIKDIEVYPNDNDYQSSDEITDNFLMVGATSYNANKKLIPIFSNYGAIQVDVFAPGHKVYSTVVSIKKYDFSNGGTSTSCALTSGVAALIRSYYPKLTASQVKHILMDSGLEYTFNVKVGDTLLSFNALSKSGKVVNAYNALIMADSFSKN
ncbi:MAG: S8 family serine peptidase [Flavobacteriaceae bacterium]|nr:S8 family serine peptidase [Flavobacteriaceae bacterium]